jgi:hypothetical protein
MNFNDRRKPRDSHVYWSRFRSMSYEERMEDIALIACTIYQGLIQSKLEILPPDGRRRCDPTFRSI